MNSNDAEGLPTSPLISVCVPMYNNGATIARCLRSVLDQDGEFEILVVDDNSSDDSVDIAATMLRAGDRLIRNESNLGGHQNHNKCLKLAAWQLHPVRTWRRLLASGCPADTRPMLRRSDCGTGFRASACGDSRTSTGCSNTARSIPTFGSLKNTTIAHLLVTQMVLRGMSSNWIGEPTCVMLRRRLALDVGGFRDDIVWLSDLDLWLRLMLRSAVCFVPQELSVRYHTPIAARELATRPDWFDHLRILTWMIVDPASPIVVRNMSRVWWLRMWLIRAQEVVIFGPDRWSRIKTLALAPFREFAHARRLRDELCDGT